MLGIIGGSGLYDLERLNIKDEHTVETPFGAPSDPIREGEFHGQRVLFLSRHGAGHRLLPHEINYRANIFALKKLGITHIISISAVGSLKEEIAAGDLVLPNQFFDHTRGKRDYSFFGDGMAGHVSMAEPVCPSLANNIHEAALRINQMHHLKKTYACVEGPRLGTRAESFFLRQIGADIVGMTNVPEVFLAREAQIAYATIAISTDYDCWQDDPSLHASVEKVFDVYGKSIEKVKHLLKEILTFKLSTPSDIVRNALSHAVLTPKVHLTPKKQELLKLLRS